MVCCCKLGLKYIRTEYKVSYRSFNNSWNGTRYIHVVIPPHKLVICTKVYMDLDNCKTVYKTTKIKQPCNVTYILRDNHYDPPRYYNSLVDFYGIFYRGGRQTSVPAEDGSKWSYNEFEDVPIFNLPTVEYSLNLVYCNGQNITDYRYSLRIIYEN